MHLDHLRHHYQPNHDDMGFMVNDESLVESAFPITLHISGVVESVIDLHDKYPCFVPHPYKISPYNLLTILLPCHSVL